MGKTLKLWNYKLLRHENEMTINKEKIKKLKKFLKLGSFSYIGYGRNKFVSIDPREYSTQFEYIWVGCARRFLCLVIITGNKYYIQGVPINMGIQWRIRYCLCYELAL